MAPKPGSSLKGGVLNREVSFLITEAKLEVKIAETKADLIRWVLGVGMLQTAMMAAMLLKLIPV